MSRWPLAVRSGAISLLVCLTLVLSACGTNLKWLVAEEGAHAWRNDRLIQLAERRDPAALSDVLDAEHDKYERCKMINSAAGERIGRLHIGFWEQLLADFKLLAALLMPLPAVERCADAHERYESAIARLENKMGVDGAAPIGPSE